MPKQAMSALLLLRPIQMVFTLIVRCRVTTPLYYAMEKQAKFNLARDEINHLANLLGDAESSKMEACEAMEEMRQKMEEAEARLRRYEKKGSAAGRGRSLRNLDQAPSPRDSNSLPRVDETPAGCAVQGWKVTT